MTVWAAETAETGEVLREYDDTPDGFGRIAATTARQVILQRLRDAEDELTFGEYAGREGDIVAGVIQQGKDPRAVLVDLGKIEAILPPTEQVPGERYVHGERLRCYVLHVRKGYRGPSVTLSRTHPNLVKKLFALEVPEIASGAVEIVAIAREAGHRTKIAVISHQAGRERQGCLHRADGQPGPERDDRAARREDRHRGLLGRIRPSSWPTRCRRPGSRGWTSSTPQARVAQVIVPDYQLSLAIGKEGQNARLAARLTGWRIDIRPDTEASGGGAAGPQPRPGREHRSAAARFTYQQRRHGCPGAVS